MCLRTPSCRLHAALAAALLLFSAAGCGDHDNFTVPLEDAGGDTGIGPDAGDVTEQPDAPGDRPDAGPREFTELDLPPVTEKGPFNVGYTELEVSHQAEADQTDEERELNLSIWYPTNEQEGPAARYANLLNREEAIEDAEPAPLESQPMLVFSHGNGGIAEQNWFMTEFWATRGWIAVSPDHTGNTFRSGTEIDPEAAVYRPQDIRAVIDRMKSLDEEHPLSGRFSDKIVMSGHSFGALTTLANAGADVAVDSLQQRCREGTAPEGYCDTFNTEKRRALFRDGFYDERIDLAIPQAPAGAEIFEEGLAELEVPTLHMTGGMDRTLPNSEEGDPIWELMEGQEHRRVNIDRAGHFTFSNMCTLFGGVERVQNDGCGDENIDSEVAFRIINNYSLAFARFHLWGDESAEEIVDGERFPVDRMFFDYSIGTE